MELKIIKPTDCKKWLLEKHYAKRMTPINKAFGLVINGHIVGVCTFAIPASRFEFSKQPYELNRLVINENIGDDVIKPKNILSKFVSMCLNNFGEDAIIVSYADENYGHHGYIYQATNWIYTGRSSAEKRMFVNGQELHRRTLYDKYGTSSIEGLRDKGLEITFEKQVGKHRYFQFTGTKKQRNMFKSELLKKYKPLPYPKGDNRRYDSGIDIKDKIAIEQPTLF
jgi:hypothetical protein